MIMRLHRQQTRSKLNISLSTTKARHIFDLQDNSIDDNTSNIIYNIINENFHVLGLQVHYRHLSKGGGLKMRQDRCKDYDSVLNKIAIRLGIIEDTNPCYVYMAQYDPFTRTAKSAALQAGEHHVGNYELVTIERQHVSCLMI